MRSIFAEGYQLVQAELAGEAIVSKPVDKPGN